MFLAEREQMSFKGSCTISYFIGRLVCLIWISTSSACAENAVDELTFTSPYASIIGAEYRIVEEVNAYGIYKNMDRKEVSIITLIPGVGIAGPEVAFKKQISKGQTIKILSAWREHRFLTSDVYYLVALQDADLPRGIQVKIKLSRGNEGVGAELNPRVYERITR